MKFTRTLSLALAAAAAFSLTACDEDDDTTSPNAAELRVTEFNMGSQEQEDLASLLSIRKNGTIFIKDLKADASNINNVDVVMYEDFNATDKKTNVNNAHLYSPDAFATDAVWSSSTLVKTYFNATAKATQTRFADLTGADFADIDTKADFEEEINAIGAAAWVNNIDVVTGDVIAIKTTDGGYAIAKITSATAVPSSSTATTSDQLAVNMTIKVAVKN